MNLRESIILSIVLPEGLLPYDIHKKYHQKNISSMPIGSLHTTLVRMTEKGLLERNCKIYSITDIGKQQLQESLSIFGVPQLLCDVNKYKTFFDQLADPVLVIGELIKDNKIIKPGKITDANNAACQVFGYSLEEFLKISPINFESPETFSKHIPITSKQLTENNEANFESIFFTKQHNPIWFEVKVKMFEWDGRIQNVSIMRDINHRKTIKKEMNETIERLKLAMWGTDLGIWDWDLVTNVVTYSNRWTEQLGYKPEELDTTYKTWEDRMHPDDLPSTLKILHSHLKGDNLFYEANFRMKHKSGKWINILARGKVVARDTDGKPLRATGTHKVLE